MNNIFNLNFSIVFISTLIANLDHIEYDLHLHYIDKKYNLSWFCVSFLCNLYLTETQ